MNRTCKKCGLEKHIDSFLKKRKKDGSVYILYTCIDCNRLYNKKYLKSYYKNNSIEIIERSKNWYLTNLNKKKKYDKEYALKKKDHKKIYDKIYRKNNKDKINQRTYKYVKNRKLNDPAYKLRKSISYSIWYYMNLNKSSKGNKSFLKFVPYTMQELKEHLEKQFDLWMNWNNYGSYHIQKWDDTDQKTWTWQIDHIIPQSKLPYTSMEDENFKKCWALDNLRPLSSKQNLIDGNKR